MINSSFSLKVRKYVDYSILRLAMFVVRISSKVGVNNRCSVNYMHMGEHADTRVVAAEQKQKKNCRICSSMWHFYDLRGANIGNISFTLTSYTIEYGWWLLLPTLRRRPWRPNDQLQKQHNKAMSAKELWLQLPLSSTEWLYVSWSCWCMGQV